MRAVGRPHPNVSCQKFTCICPNQLKDLFCDCRWLMKVLTRQRVVEEIKSISRLQTLLLWLILIRMLNKMLETRSMAVVLQVQLAEPQQVRQVQRMHKFRIHFLKLQMLLELVVTLPRPRIAVQAQPQLTLNLSLGARATQHQKTHCPGHSSI